jgi:hypothetical protein
LFATLKGCAALGGTANKGVKIFARTLLRGLYVEEWRRDLRNEGNAPNAGKPGTGHIESRIYSCRAEAGLSGE